MSIVLTDPRGAARLTRLTRRAHALLQRWRDQAGAVSQPAPHGPLPPANQDHAMAGFRLECAVFDVERILAATTGPARAVAATEFRRELRLLANRLGVDITGADQ